MLFSLSVLFSSPNSSFYPIDDNPGASIIPVLGLSQFGKSHEKFIPEYIKSSIYDPNADIVEGFSKGLMLSYEGQLSEDDITNIVESLKSIK